MITITERAVAEVHRIVKEQSLADTTVLRVGVKGGGCSGFQYGFDLDDSLADDDLTFKHGGVTVVIDETSLGLLEGSEVDFKTELGGSFFQITNPNATSSCGCGSSFAI